jgi:hypothetical protein
MILQLDPAILVDKPLGKGHAIFIIDYGMHQFVLGGCITQRRRYKAF